MLQTVALTGGTGFVGAAILSALTAAGYPVRTLARVDRPDLPGITWIRGDLRTPDSLRALTDGADVVIHCAGAIKALDAQGFLEVNALGTKRLLDACAGRALRFVHISSLAARAPSLSAYAGSKAAAERAVMESGLDWLILRPGAVYGPGDRATLSLFQAVKWGVAPVFSEARAAVVHVADVASAVLAGLTQGRGIVADLHDGAPGGGYTQLEIFRMIGAALGKTPRVLHIPARWPNAWRRSPSRSLAGAARLASSPAARSPNCITTDGPAPTRPWQTLPAGLRKSRLRAASPTLQPGTLHTSGFKLPCFLHEAPSILTHAPRQDWTP
ncbi:NAD-dependent epimerase/dehydratase family protein [Hankyongella ginsenosidimutans]|uniref:NAD-dependent epimerase/dehydratase family protein n=1 Tax=Hankyongella ginsenosidimutans TaxID=1763828 RepID=UPI001FE3A27D|nr:NAD-dependent epimerase/dehydratase family protein [Hankyongella ginsenosidimutans]